MTWGFNQVVGLLSDQDSTKEKDFLQQEFSTELGHEGVPEQVLRMGVGPYRKGGSHSFQLDLESPPLSLEMLGQAPLGHPGRPKTELVSGSVPERHVDAPGRDAEVRESLLWAPGLCG